MRRVLTLFLLFVSLYTTLYAGDCDCSKGGSDSSSLSCSSDSSDNYYCTHHPKKRSSNTFGPNLKIVFTPFRLTDCSIFSICGEGGSNNTRFSGTFGYFFTPKLHFKWTIEQLNQRVDYHFTSGRAQKWMHQLAGGGVLEYAFCHRYLESLEVFISYAGCKSRHLKTASCCVKRLDKLKQVERHIAGGTDLFGGIGITLNPWNCATFYLAADYDHVRYKTKFLSNSSVSGFGAIAKFHQKMGCGVSIDLKGELRRPFNYYEGAINWTNSHPYGILTFGAYTGYTQGLGRLPNTWTTGVLVSADFGGMPFYSKYRNCAPPPPERGCKINTCFPLDRELLAWIAEPAVRMPSVLAISEEIVSQTNTRCPPPPQPKPEPPEPDCELPNSVTIPDQTSLPFDTSAFFDRKGHPMVFTAEGLPNFFFIDSASGIIYGNIEDIGTRFVRVTGTTECGETSEIFRLINPFDPYGPYDPYGPFDPLLPF